MTQVDFLLILLLHINSTFKTPRYQEEVETSENTFYPFQNNQRNEIYISKGMREKGFTNMAK